MDILDAASVRMRIVRAVPGSGKTWLVGEVLRRELANWRNRQQGVAVLSFTNTARDEVVQQLGTVPGHPHFIGTLDAFVYRYIVKPFAALYDGKILRPRIIPAAVAQQLSKTQPWGDIEVVLGASKRRVNIFNVSFVGEATDSTHAVLAARLDKRAQLTIIPEPYRSQIAKRKMEVWRKSGYMSHADVVFVASKIIACTGVLEALERRFPFFVVDELQDTGLFLTRLLLAWASREKCRGMVVGDPDQAIYEFNGAKPELFGEFEKVVGAKLFELGRTRRFGANIARVASQLTRPRRDILSRCAEPGIATLLVYDDPREVVSFVRHLRESLRTERLCVVARQHSAIRELAGTTAAQLKFRSRALETLHDGIVHLREGAANHGFLLSAAAVARVVMGTEQLDDEQLRAIGLSRQRWRRLVVNILLKADTSLPGETVYEWSSRMVGTMRVECEKAGLIATQVWKQRLRMPPEALKRVLRDTTLPTHVAQELCATVHSVKGQTHDVTVFYVPWRGEARCPSQSWWSDAEDAQEERRVAFVALTRPRERLVLCIHRKSYMRFAESRSDFISLFSIVDGSGYTSTDVRSD